MTDHGPFDLIVRQTLAAMYFEAERIVNGDAACLYDQCPHSIDMSDLLIAVTRVHPPLYEEISPPAALAN